jgi:hypothetical protein
VLACTREWDFKKSDFDRLNVHGSGISLGHPVGATGRRILATLLREMDRRGASLGLETMCIGGGQGLAAIFEAVDYGAVDYGVTRLTGHPSTASANVARKIDPQLARIYYVQMVERGAHHNKAVCIVAAHLAGRAWTTLRRGTPYVLRDIDGTEVTVAEGKAILLERYQVPEAVRRRLRTKKAGKVLTRCPQHARAEAPPRLPSLHPRTCHRGPPGRRRREPDRDLRTGRRRLRSSDFAQR